MAGIYIHIPFCKQACHYCNFHFSTSLKYKSEMIVAILQEIKLQKDYLQQATIDTIYFGGGTPSLLSVAELESIFQQIYRFHQVADDVEITLEANPDDLTKIKLKELASTSVNRLSIGIQSFSEEDLRFMNRAHHAKEAENCIHWAQEVGFFNLTVDLIYGSQTTSDATWESNIQKVLDFNIPHLSCYALTVEPKTALDHFIRSGKAQAVDEVQSAHQFEQLIQKLKASGYIHYEISNFAKAGHFARHNSNYWKGVPYLGLGPSAHSFDEKSRQWNVAHNAQYLKAIQENTLPYEREILTSEQQYNEYVMTGLRTVWGCDLGKINQFGIRYRAYFLKEVDQFLREGFIVVEKDIYRLTSSGKLLADGIAASLFF